MTIAAVESDSGILRETRSGVAAALSGSGPAADHAHALLHSMGIEVARCEGRADPHPDGAWARSGAMWLSGDPVRPPLLAPTPIASCADGALRALRALAGGPAALAAIDGPALLGERAALLGLTRRGAIAPGGQCRLVACVDGTLAVNLPRADDERLLDAWIGCAPGSGARPPWSELTRALASWRCEDALARARLLGLAVAPAGPPPAEPPPWLRVRRLRPAAPAPARAPRVVDLSSLWAGPLAGALLVDAGAPVWKVESTARPDGARAGPRAFFDLMNAGKRSVAVDFTRAAGLRALQALLESADVVLESARPRALEQLGIDASTWVRGGPGRCWVSITGYGRREPEAGWVAFGDDAAAAAGLADAATPAGDAPLFCGDAIADPLTGLHAACAALAHHRTGGGVLLELALRDVVASGFASTAACAVSHVVQEADGAFSVCGDDGKWPVSAPRARCGRGRARELGADTDAVLAALPC